MLSENKVKAMEAKVESISWRHVFDPRTNFSGIIPAPTAATGTRIEL